MHYHVILDMRPKTYYLSPFQIIYSMYTMEAIRDSALGSKWNIKMVNTKMYKYMLIIGAN